MSEKNPFTKAFQKNAPNKKTAKTNKKTAEKDAIFNYTPKGLVTGNITNRDYVFIDDTTTITIRYDVVGRQAKVIMIKGNEEGEEYTYSEITVVGCWTDETVEIEHVYMQNATGKRYCTKSVAYMLKVLITEAANNKTFPYKGVVNLVSQVPRKALYCYSHAFVENGFQPDRDEITNFINQVDSDFGFAFQFKKFISTEQMRLSIEQMRLSEKKSSESSESSEKSKSNQLRFL
jgi:hypothetical protein